MSDEDGKKRVGSIKISANHGEIPINFESDDFNYDIPKDLYFDSKVDSGIAKDSETAKEHYPPTKVVQQPQLPPKKQKAPIEPVEKKQPVQSKPIPTASPKPQPVPKVQIESIKEPVPEPVSVEEELQEAMPELADIGEEFDFDSMIDFEERSRTALSKGGPSKNLATSEKDFNFADQNAGTVPSVEVKSGEPFSDDDLDFLDSAEPEEQPVVKETQSGIETKPSTRQSPDDVVSEEFPDIETITTDVELGKKTLSRVFSKTEEEEEEEEEEAVAFDSVQEGNAGVNADNLNAEEASALMEAVFAESNVEEHAEPSSAPEEMMLDDMSADELSELQKLLEDDSGVAADESVEVVNDPDISALDSFSAPLTAPAPVEKKEEPVAADKVTKSVEANPPSLDSMPVPDFNELQDLPADIQNIAQEDSSNANSDKKRSINIREKLVHFINVFSESQILGLRCIDIVGIIGFFVLSLTVMIIVIKTLN